MLLAKERTSMAARRRRGLACGLAAARQARRWVSGIQNYYIHTYCRLNSVRLEASQGEGACDCAPTQMRSNGSTAKTTPSTAADVPPPPLRRTPPRRASKVIAGAAAFAPVASALGLVMVCWCMNKKSSRPAEPADLAAVSVAGTRTTSCRRR